MHFSTGQPEDKQKATQQFTKLQAAMKVLNISTEEQRVFWLVLGAIYHLGAAGATKGKSFLHCSETHSARNARCCMGCSD